MSKDRDDRGAAPAEEFGPMDTRSIRVGLDNQNMSAAELVEAIFRKMRQSAIPSSPMHRKFLGWAWAEWLRNIALGAIGLGGVLYAWYQSVNDGLKARPTKDEVEQAIHVHAGTPGQHQGLEKALQETRESQIRTEVEMVNQVKALDAINQNLREIKITVRR